MLQAFIAEAFDGRAKKTTDRAGTGRFEKPAVSVETSPLIWRKSARFSGLGGGWHYLDSGATAQKPQSVIDATVNAMGRDYATVHRGVYARSANMTLA
jgi:cysteine desulfurase/selenocysteine lyase